MRTATLYGLPEHAAIGLECAWPLRLPDPLAPLAAPARAHTGQRRTARLRRYAVLALAALGIALFGHGAYIQAKAWLAQVLLERAWAATLAGAPAAKPWPWADTWPVARLVAPAQGESVLVLAGANGRTIAFGPGHMFGTAQPGQPGNSVIAAHRDTHFAFLRELAPGDALDVQDARGQWQRYRVQAAAVVDKGDVALAAPSADTRLTLVTCYPFDALRAGGPLRYVVTAAAEDMALAADVL